MSPRSNTPLYFSNLVAATDLVGSYAVVEAVVFPALQKALGTPRVGLLPLQVVHRRDEAGDVGAFGDVVPADLLVRVGHAGHHRDHRIPP